MNNKQIAAELVRIAGMLVDSPTTMRLSASKKEQIVNLAKGLIESLQNDDIKSFQSRLRKLNNLSGMKKLV